MNSDIYFLPWALIQCWFCCCRFSNCSVSATGSSFRWLLHPLTCPVIVFWFLALSYFLALKMLQAHPVHFPPQSQNQPFLQGPWLLFVEMLLETPAWALGSRLPLGCPCLWALSGEDSTRVCTNWCADTYAYVKVFTRSQIVSPVLTRHHRGDFHLLLRCLHPLPAGRAQLPTPSARSLRCSRPESPGSSTG